MNDDDWITVENPLDRPIAVVVDGTEAYIKPGDSLQVRVSDR